MIWFHPLLTSSLPNNDDDNDQSDDDDDSNASNRSDKGYRLITVIVVDVDVVAVAVVAASALCWCLWRSSGSRRSGSWSSAVPWLCWNTGLLYCLFVLVLHFNTCLASKAWRSMKHYLRVDTKNAFFNLVFCVDVIVIQSNEGVFCFVLSWVRNVRAKGSFEKRHLDTSLWLSLLLLLLLANRWPLSHNITDPPLYKRYTATHSRHFCWCVKPISSKSWTFPNLSK